LKPVIRHFFDIRFLMKLCEVEVSFPSKLADSATSGGADL
jgi:hypothetical protein